MEPFYLKANYCLSFSFVQNYALKVKVINSVSAESAEFLNCRAGELITLIAKDCHRYTVIICFSAFSLLLVADRPTKLAFRLLVCGLKPGLDFSEDSISSKKWLLMVLHFWYAEVHPMRYKPTQDAWRTREIACKSRGGG